MRLLTFIALFFTLIGGTAMAEEKIRVACIGDSITFGTKIKKRKTESYPVQLQKLLGDKYEVRNFGNPGRGVIKNSKKGRGWRSFIKMKEHKQALKFNPHIVICNLGINDIPEFPHRKDKFVPDYVELLTAYNNLKTNPKFYIWTKLGPITKNHRRFGTKVPEDINLELVKVAKQIGATGIDMHTPFIDKHDLFPDGIHPNGTGAAIVAKVTYRTLTGKEAPAEETAAETANKAVTGDKIRVACIGDSITFGARIKNRAADSYPTQLQKLLGDKYEVKNFGNSGRGIIKTSKKGRGWRAFIKMKEHKNALKFNPDIVICNLGINDLMDFPKKKKNGKGTHGDDFVKDYKELLNAYRNLTTNPRIIIWTPLAPLYKGQKFFGSPTVGKINKAIEQVISELNTDNSKKPVEGIDMETPLSGKPEMFPDHIHPNGAGAKIIAEETHKVLTK